MLVSTDFADALFFAQQVCQCRVRLAAEEDLLARWRLGHPARAHRGRVQGRVSDLCPAAPLLAIGWRERGSADFFILLSDHPAVADDRAIQARLAHALTTAAYWLVVLATTEQQAVQVCILDAQDAVGGEPVCIEQRPCPGLLPRSYLDS
jgi:hypothetical protein